MKLTELTAVSPIDGRYRDKTADLAPYFSEYALIRARVEVEIEYLLALSKAGLPEFQSFPAQSENALRKVYRNFTVEQAAEIKATEAKIAHDVKAVEYFVKDKMPILGLDKWKEFVHFGLTSQDINNTAVPLLIKRFREEQLSPRLDAWHGALLEHAKRWKAIPMLARTHGQPASPTGLGKEIAVFADRVSIQIKDSAPTPTPESLVALPAISMPTMQRIRTWTGRYLPTNFLNPSAWCGSRPLHRLSITTNWRPCWITSSG